VIVFACFAMTAALVYFIFNLPTAVEHPVEKTRLAFLRERKEMVYENLRDLNFEYKAGKLPEADYAQLRAGLEEDAAAILAEIEQLEQQQLAVSN
jgi:outer membrane protein TolC